MDSYMGLIKERGWMAFTTPAHYCTLPAPSSHLAICKLLKLLSDESFGDRKLSALFSSYNFDWAPLHF